MAERIVTLPSGSQTIVDDGPNGPTFPYLNELSGKDLQFAQNMMATGSQQIAQQNSPAWAGPNQSDPYAYITQQGTNINNLGAQNDAAMQQLQRQQQEIFKQQNNLGVQNQNYVTGVMGNAGWLAGQNANLAGQSWQSTNDANAADQGYLGQYTQALQNATSWDLGNYGNLAGAYANTGILKAGGYGPDVVSQAQYAQADPGAIQAQYQALGQLQGAANGSLNQTSQAAQAYADAGDIANQRQAADQLQAIANGSKDVHVGQEDPAAYASAMDALQHFTSLSNPEITAQERFIYEQARLKQEQDDRSNRAAVMSNLRQRGMSGAGAEIGDLALANQRTSQNRLLSDLGAQANAVQRAMVALQGQAGLSSNLNAQANALATGNADRQTAAQNMASQAYATLRAQGFSEEYARGQAADIMATANADRQLNAMVGSGNLASNMRTQSFNEDFSRRSAADSMSQFNKEQSQISQRWQEQYAANQQTDAWNRSTDMFDAANKVGQNYVNNSTGLFNAQTGTNNAADIRRQNSINTTGNLNQSTVNAWNNAANTGIYANQAQSGTYAQQLAAMTQLGQTGMQNNTNMTQLRNQNLQNGLGYQMAGQANNFAAQQLEQSKSQGLFGTPILSQEGILGIKGIPIL